MEDNKKQDAAVQDLIIEGAGCASCVGKLESALKKVNGVTEASMNFADRTVTVTGKAETNELINAVENAGYNAKSNQGLLIVE